MITEKEKREYIILGILVLVIVGVLYFYFFGGSNNTPAVSISSITGDVSIPDESRVAYLPYGPNLNLDIFKLPGYAQLVSPAFPPVSPSDLGVSDPFQVIK